MDNNVFHITVCICTYKRPHLLAGLLTALQNQRTESLFTYSIVVVDNDYEMSGKMGTENAKRKSSVAIAYYVEPRKSYSHVRNKAVEESKGNCIAFIDDDESPDNDWLYNLYKTLKSYNADGVLGPVKPLFKMMPPKWILQSKICERQTFKTGTVLYYDNTRTGNVLFSRRIFDVKENYFDPNYGKTGGEDVDFFKRMIEKGYRFVWCNEAPVYEIVPPERWKRAYYLRKALMRGKVVFYRESNKMRLHLLMKSMIAFSIYTLLLPFFFVLGEHIFMKYLIKDCDHIGFILATFKLNLVRRREM